jgi:hypothetical protein
MPIQKRLIGIDDLDRPNQPLAPSRPDYRANDYAPISTRRDIGPRATALLIGVGVVTAGVLAYLAIRFANYIASVNGSYDTSTLDYKILTVIKLALGLGIVALIFAGVALAVVFVSQRMIVRMQNNQPVSVFDVLGGWRNDRAHTFSRDALNWYHSERSVWGAASQYWSLNTLDLSQATRTDRQAFGGDIVDGQIIADPPAMLPALTGKEIMIERLLSAGLINRSGNSLLVGFAAPDKPIYIELEDTGFIALAGMPRVGKSSTASLIAGQVALIPDSILIVCDKHGRKNDSLLARLAPLSHRIARTAIDTTEIIAAIDFWHEIGSNRLLEDDATKHKYPPCFLIIDEFTAMILLALLPAATIQKLVSAAVEFPKVQAHGLIIGHQWTGKLLGNALGAPLRRVTTQRIIHRIDPQDAEFLIPPAYAKQCQTLPEGGVIFMGADQPTPIELTVPYMTADDLEYLGRMIPASATHATAQSAPIAPGVAAVASVASALQSAETIDLDPDTDPVNAVDLSNDQLTTDRRARLAKLLLSKESAPGKYAYTYRQVQAMTNLRTATICAIAVNVGRARS